MQFEPRIVQPDEPDDDLQLPADLALLAEQLTADAAHIAECHAVGSPAATSTSSQSARRWGRGLAAAVVLLAASLGVSRWAFQPAVRPAGHRGDLVRVAGEDHRARSDLKKPLGAAVPAVFFQGLTGPEQEGLLDLLEDQSLRQSSLSI